MAEEFKPVDNEEPAKSGKGRIQVSLLDDTVVAFHVEPRGKGSVLYQKVNGHLKVEESDYFGLQYYDTEGNMCWLDPQKSINKQVKEALKVTFKFRVMFYTPDPSSLQEYTRYLFTLQVRRDLLDGRLHCSEDTGALLASYIVQGELGDFDEKNHHNGYLSGFQFVPHQSPAIEEKILQYHMRHRGKSPAEADRSMLEVARQLEMYGITLYPAKDRDEADLSLSVYHMGILVFQNQKKINMFSWAKIRKLSFKKKKFLIKLHPKVYTADLVEFVMQSRNACKGFWKICIAHHVFFRQKQATHRKVKPTLLSRGSKFRYSGRTQKQLMEDCKETFTPIKNELERTHHASRIQRGSDVSSGEIAALPTTPPPSYSSFNFDTTPVENNQSTSSVKDSTDASEDEGSLTISPTKSPSHVPDSDILMHVDENSVLDNSVHLQRKSDQMYQVNGGEASGRMEGEEVAEQKLRSESDLEIEREVNSMYDQIKKETTWQYHLTSTEFDDVLFSSNDQEKIPPITLENELTNPVIYRDILNDLSSTSDHPKEVAESETADVISSEICYSIKDDVQSQENEGASAANEHMSKIICHEEDIDEDIGRCLSEDAIDTIQEQSDKNPGSASYESASYHMARDVLLTERTYIKDLEILTVSFREDMVTKDAMSDSLMTLFFGNIDPLYDFHCSFLAELEDRLFTWKEAISEGRNENVFKISDIMLSNVRNLKLYVGHIKMHYNVLLNFQEEICRSEKLSTACKEFELNKICYLPLNTLLLKPAQRLFYYKFILSRMHKELSSDDASFPEIKAAYTEMYAVYESLTDVLKNLENLHKLIELNQDLINVDGLVHPNREFIREGCLYKVGKSGPLPRMFFLFSDTLLYTSQGVNAENQFCVRSQMPLETMKLRDGGVELHGLYPFTIEFKSGKSFVVAATSLEDRLKWIEDIKFAISTAKEKSICNRHENDEFHQNDDKVLKPVCNSLQSFRNGAPLPVTIRKYPSKGSDSDSENSEDLLRGASTLERKHAHVRTLSTRRVCWHRNTSISMNEYKISAQNNISGELLRKSKDHSKWQRLWVIFTNFTLFFFKSYEDDEPLASLPLIGYDVSRPAENDSIGEEFCFKLHFKAHEYFFKTENHYTFQRWMEALTSITKNSSRTRIFSRMTSE